MADVDLVALSEVMAEDWHGVSDHGRDGAPFGGWLCNCLRIANRAVSLGWWPTSGDGVAAYIEAKRGTAPNGAGQSHLPIADHPHADPGDGRSECETCGKWIWPATHSCKGVPVTAAARERLSSRAGGDS